MMGNSRTNEKDKPPASANPLIQLNNDYTKSIAPNMHSVGGVSFREGNFAGGRFDSVPDMPVAPGWENMCSINHSIAQGIPETSGNHMAYLMNSSSFQNSQFNLLSNTANTDIPEVPLIPEWNMRWSPQFINQEHNAISAGGLNNGSGTSSFENPWSSKNPTTARNFVGDSQMSRQGRESKFAPFNRPHANADIVGSPLSFGPRDTATVHTRNNVNFNTSQCGVQGKVEGSFLSLGIGGTDETITRPQTGVREMSDTLKEAASAELQIARARRAMGQTLDAGFMGLQRNISGFSNQSCHVDRITSTNNEAGVQCTLNSGPGSSPYHTLQMQQNDMQHGISRHDDGSSNFLSSRNIRYGDLDHYRAFVGNQAANSGTVGGNSAQFFNSQQYDLNGLAPESSKPSWIASHTPSGQLQSIRYTTVNSLPLESSTNSPSLGLGSCSTRQNYAGQQLLSHNGMSTQGLGGSLFPQRIAAPQVAWVSSGQAATDAPFPKRLGVELNGKDSPQVAERHLSTRGTNLQTTSTGQICQFPDKGSTFLPDHLLQRSIGQSQDALIQLPKDPRAAASTNASTVDDLSQKSDFHMRPSHKRTAVAPPSASHWVQRQKITHPTIHHSVPIPFPTKLAIPGTTALVHPSIPVASQRELGCPVSASIHPSIPGTSHFKSRIPVKPAPIAAHIAWKDPDRTPQLTGYKCLLCKRDLSLTSEGAVYQPVPPPPVAVLPCGHTFHDQCLQNITPQDQSKDPPCIPCAIGDN
ncbi:Zinc finger, RING/FYVE/PHD-type [Cynara cardunculus var. scolymus]|uniref:Zinc finger, RING/FYVE/PHD-type n=1 Tax=Cynara cardunculus var. scolymus TaxID=59895 RepID=A0A118JY66_CYNCS|nr:Zinc finger, RING/FYVE/PHD-type [Cynara cardunculus var. scolymus]